MTSTPHNNSDSGTLQLPGDQRLSRNLDPAEISSASGVVHALNRAIKTLCLYPTGNPVCAESLGQFHKAISDHLSVYHIISLGIRESKFSFHGEILDGQSTDDGLLAGICFVCGIYELRFTEGFTHESAEELLTLFRAIATKERTDDDLAEALWGEIFPGFAYDVIEDIPIVEYDEELRSEYFASQEDHESGLQDPNDSSRFNQVFVESQSPDDPRLKADSSERFEESLKELADDGSSGDGTSSAEDQESSHPPLPSIRELIADVYVLESEDAQKAAADLSLDACIIYGREAVLLCGDLLEENEALPDFVDALHVCLRVHGQLIAIGELRYAAELGIILQGTAQKLSKTRPNWGAKVVESLATVGSRERMGLLAIALNEHEDIEVEELSLYLKSLDWTAYAALIETLGTLENKSHRMTICEYFSSVGEEHLDLLASGMYDKRWYVVRNSVTILAQHDHPRAHKHLIKALKHEDVRVRKEALVSCSSHSSEFVCAVLQICIDDSEKEIRSAALELASKQRGLHAFKLFRSIAIRKDFGSMPYEFRNKILHGYSRVGGKHAIPGLLNWICGFSFFLSPEKQEMRERALAALARNESPEALAALKKLAGSWVPKVRRPAKLAYDQNSRLASRGNSNE